MSGQVPFLPAVMSLFACMLLLGLVVAGLVIMVAPSLGEEMFKTIGIAVVLFISGSLLLQALHFAGLLSRLVVLAAALVLLVCAFLYPFDPKGAQDLIKKIGLGAAALLFLPLVVIELARALNPAVLGIAVVIVPLAAYWLREYRRPRREPRQRPYRPERTPSLPRGGPGI